MSIWTDRSRTAAKAASVRAARCSAWTGGFLGIADPAHAAAGRVFGRLIALSAKMAKADGVVTGDEVAPFADLRGCRRARRAMSPACSISPSATSPASRATRRAIASLYGDEPQGLEDVLDGLFSIARADGAVHEAELRYLEGRSPKSSASRAPLSRDRSPSCRRRRRAIPTWCSASAATLELATIRSAVPQAGRRKPSRPARRPRPAPECIAIATSAWRRSTGPVNRIERERRR